MVPVYLAYLSSLFAIVEWEKPYFTWSCLGSSVVCLISEASMAFFFLPRMLNWNRQIRTLLIFEQDAMEKMEKIGRIVLPNHKDKR